MMYIPFTNSDRNVVQKNQDDDEIVESLLGSMNHTMQTLTADVLSLLV